MKCELCGWDNYRVLYKGNGKGSFKYYDNNNYGRILKCDRCGLIFSEHSSISYESIVDKDYLKSEAARVKTAERDILGIEQFRRELFPGSILDVGCAAGYFLQAAKERGWKVCGIESNKPECIICERKGLRVINSKLENVRISEQFDVITMLDVIEHLAHPAKALEKVNSLLKSEGLLVLNTPNINSLYARLTGRKWPNLMSMHLFYFSPETITELLKNAGFKVVMIQSYSRIIMPKYAVEWFKNYGVLYKFFKWLFGRRAFGNLKLSVNLGDNMLIYARKI